MNLRSDDLEFRNGPRRRLPRFFLHLARRFACAGLGFVFLALPRPGTAKTVIALPDHPSADETLAAREVRRYLNLRTGELSAILAAPKEVAKSNDLILVARKDRAIIPDFLPGLALRKPLASLPAQSYALKTVEREGRRILLLAGGDDPGVLYAAYHFAEILGVRFYLHGDVIPDDQAPLVWPALDEWSSPLFALRGILPFHDFPEGPDWWNRDDYLAVLAQLPKLRMNFIGLHTYPEDRPNAEPTVWLGLPKDADERGRVQFSYPASYHNTLRGNWGYEPKNTRKFSCGGALLFDQDAYAAEVMAGDCPAPDTMAACNELFNRTAALLREAFRFAHRLGIKTCAGTETPLLLPGLLWDHLEKAGKDMKSYSTLQEVYEGIFQRVAKSYDLDYYWFWTSEDWTWKGNSVRDLNAAVTDITVAIAAAKAVRAPFQLATSGWVLGPQSDRALLGKELPPSVALSCINQEMGRTPVDAAFAKIDGHSKWAIPWLEDDAALTTPQLWVARMRRDAADALKYGCDGLLGIHWRTRVLGPNVAALAQAAWEQDKWRPAAAGPADPPAPPGADDFFEDWAAHEFGAGIGPESARIFERLDGKLPRPTDWRKGPGALVPNAQPWDEVKHRYDFADEFASLADRVKGAGNRERFNYWSDYFAYMKSVAQLGCAWGEYTNILGSFKVTDIRAEQKKRARELALPAHERIARLTETVYGHLLEVVSTTGELGTVANWEEHILPHLVERSGKRLAEIMGDDLPPEAFLSQDYQGRARIIVPAVRGCLMENETSRLRVLILSRDPVRQAALHWRKLGPGPFTELPLTHLTRGVYSVQFPPAAEDLEYYITAAAPDGATVCYPATAPAINQTIVTLPEASDR